MHIMFIIFFFNDTATTEIYTLSLHDALPIWCVYSMRAAAMERLQSICPVLSSSATVANSFDSKRSVVKKIFPDRKSSRLNSSHLVISYAVFCLKKKKNYITSITKFNNDYLNV